MEKMRRFVNNNPGRERTIIEAWHNGRLKQANVRDKAARAMQRRWRYATIRLTRSLYSNQLQLPIKNLYVNILRWIHLIGFVSACCGGSCRLVRGHLVDHVIESQIISWQLKKVIIDVYESVWA